MLRVAAEVQDVQLGEAQVLEQHPGGVREVRYFDAGELQRPVAHRVVEADVRPAAFQQVEQMVAEGFVPTIGWLDCLGGALFAGAFLLHDSPCCSDWTGATGIATAAVSGASPR